MQEILRAVEKKRNEIVELVRELIRTPSPTGKEGEVAAIIMRRMETEGFSQVIVDPVGNVVGIVKGQRQGKSLIYNGHMDHVPPGEMDEPYSAKILDGARFGVEGPVVYGRGASDMKGALGAMLMAGSILNELNLAMKGDLIVAATVFEEELGNIGPPSLMDIDGLKPDAAVVGECTDLDVALGNRGVVRTRITTYGRSCHVSIQDRGVNALYKMVKVIERIQETKKTLPSHQILGKASWATCKVAVTPNIVNVVPDRCEIEVDTRSIPNFPLEQVTNRQQRILNELANTDPEFRAEVSFIEKDIESWNGYKTKVRPIALPFYTKPNHWLVDAGRASIRESIGKEASLKIWGFTTEGYFFSERGIPVIGFGPGEERFTHSNGEVLSIEDLVAATKVYAVLAVNVCDQER